MYYRKLIIAIGVLFILCGFNSCVPISKMTKQIYATDTREVVKKSEHSVELLERELKDNKILYVFKFKRRDLKEKQKKNYFRDAFRQWETTWMSRGTYFTSWVDDAYSNIKVDLPEGASIIENEEVETDEKGILRLVVKLGKKIEEYTYVDCITFSYEEWTYQDKLR